MKLRVIVFGAHGPHRTEASLVRAARSLGHAAALIDCGSLGAPGSAAAGPPCAGWCGDWAPDLVFYPVRRDAGRRNACSRRRPAVARALVLRPGAAAARAHSPAGPGRRHDVRHLPVPGRAVSRGRVPTVRFLPQAADPAIDRPARRVPRRVSLRGVVRRLRPVLLSPRAARAARRGSATCRCAGRDGTGWPGACRSRAGRCGGGDSPRRSAARRSPSARSPSRAAGRARLRLEPDVEGHGLRRLLPRSRASRAWSSFARGGEHCAWYDSTEEAVELVRQYLAAPEARAAIAEAGRDIRSRPTPMPIGARGSLDGRTYPSP